jgi:hypothetical protein
MRFARGQRIGIARARNDKLGAVTPDALDLGGRGDVGQKNRGGHAEPLRRIGDRRAMIAAGGRDHAGRGYLAQQQIGKGAARLERAGMLQQFQLESDRQRRQAEIGEIGGKQRCAADIGADHGFGRRNALARDLRCRCHGGVFVSASGS